MSPLSSKELIQIVLDSFEAERVNDIDWGRKLISEDFRRVSMSLHEDTLFPRLQGAEQINEALQQVYSVKGREFYVWNTAANESTQTVFVELVESEPINDRVATWPYVLICEIREGKIARTRHYGDPRLFDAGIDVKDIESIVNE